MSQNMIKWLSRGLSITATVLSFWWSELIVEFNFDNFKSYVVFCVVGLLSVTSGFLGGYRKCAINHDIKGNL